MYATTHPMILSCMATSENLQPGGPVENSFMHGANLFFLVALLATLLLPHCPVDNSLVKIINIHSRVVTTSRRLMRTDLLSLDPAWVLSLVPLSHSGQAAISFAFAFVIWSTTTFFCYPSRDPRSTLK